MSRRARTFTQADVSRALRGAIKGGLQPTRIEIDADGKIVILCEIAPEPSADDPAGWEQRLRRANGWTK
jgi:hypothetical protein